MYLHPCFFLYLYNYIRGINNREGGGVISPLKIECGFNCKTFFVVSLQSHDVLFAFQYFEFIFKVFIHKAEKDIVSSSSVNEEAYIFQSS